MALPPRRLLLRVVPLLLLGAAALAARGADAVPAASAPVSASAGGQSWTTETLSNGLRVIYAPMPGSPATHVRVLYHVGSRDERADRQGFAHMFEHMMFRGSAHVAPEEHGKLIGLVGGFSNAFTSFDKTVYYETLPSSYTDMALWLEADRMSSFKVSTPIFVTERQVVAEEWRMRLNRPYGGLFDLLMPEVFKVHPYRWTPIGNMGDLQAATAPELQQFFEKYYVPNNAILVVAGNIDVEKTRAEVQRFFGWIPARGEQAGAAGPAATPVKRDIPAEPPQTQPRRLEVKMPAPLADVIVLYRMPPEASDDLDAINLLSIIAGSGQSSRLYQALVTNESPLAVDASFIAQPLEDGGVMGVDAQVLQGKSQADVEKVLRQQVTLLRDEPVKAEELEKAKQQMRMALAQRFETAEKVASELGDEMLIHGTLDRVATARERMEKLTPADLQRVARLYFRDDAANTMIVTPGPFEGPPPGSPTTAPATATAPASGAAPASAPAVSFPADYPPKAPMTGTLPAATFEKGTESVADLPGAATAPRVIVMEDHRMPVINWNLAIRSGSHAEPAGKEGLASLTADMVRRGPKGKTFDQFNNDLESRAIDLSVADAGDNTRVSGTCLKEQFPYALQATKDMLLAPAFDADEFARLKEQSLSEFQSQLDNAQTLASRELTRSLYGESPLGRLTTMASLSGSTLDDVKKFYNAIYRADGAVLVISGDITVAEGQRAAQNFFTGFATGALPSVDYTLPKPASDRRILLVDRPESRQASIRIGIPAYSIRSEEKFTGTLANQILSNGTESRLGKYVRAEKGYVYGISGYFQPSRQAGAFVGQTDTKFETTADTVKAMFKVFDDMKQEAVPDQELADAKFRVSGQLLMQMQTVSDQAGQRLSGILNGYPADYYDKYASRLAPVTSDQIKSLMNKYVLEDRMTVVVVGPASTLKAQLEPLGAVEVVKPR